jgi:uncharacterized protein (TIGR02597 family)
MPSSNSCFNAIFLALLMTGTIQSARAEVVSRAAGYTSVTCTGGSDTVVSIPFHRPVRFSSAVSGNPVVSATTASLGFQADRELLTSELTDEPHYLQFTGGSRNGWIYPVTSHDADSITIDLENDNLAGVGDGDIFEVIPYWTLATLFPPAEQTAVHPSTGKLAPQRESRVLFFDEIGDGTNLAPDRIYFLTSEGWFRSDRGFPAADDTVIPPGKAFVIRHPDSAANTEFAARWHVHAKGHSSALRTLSGEGKSQDTTVALLRPVAVKLSDLDLGVSFTDSSSNSSGNRRDELVLYDNLTAAFNKEPSVIYFRVGGEWRRDDGNSYPASDDEEIPSTTGLLIRKSSTAAGASVRWLNLPRY